MSSCPKQRIDGLVITQTAADLLVYDENAKALHALNAPVRRVWELCDGTRTAGEIGLAAGLGDDDAHRTLSHLVQIDLVDGYVATARSSRRGALKKAAVVALPVIVSITVPLAAANASCAALLPPDSECNPAKDCCDPGRYGFSCVPLAGSGGAIGLCQ